MVRTLSAVISAVAVSGVLTACGSTQDTQPLAGTGSAERLPPSESASTVVEPTAGQPAQCTADTLAGKITPGDAGAGQRHATLVVTNTGTQPCTIYGYGGLQLLDAAKRPNPTNLTREPSPGPSQVTLPPGGTASKNLHWGVVPTGDEPVTGPCQPESTAAAVIAPDDTVRFTVSFDFGSVCGKGTIRGSAYFG